MSYISPFLRRFVVERAGDRCEYCQLAQSGQEATFHIDHVVPIASGGLTTAENLALACVSCSLKKGAKEFVIRSGRRVRLFNPRIDEWKEHFEWRDTLLEARTIIGQVTIDILDQNRRLILAIREEEKRFGRFP